MLHDLSYGAALLLVCSSFCVAQAEPTMSEGERLFVEGTALFKAPEGSRNPSKGLEKLLASAEQRYGHAPFGLCIALSTEPDILNLTESYAWCEVAAISPSRFAGLAKETALQVLGRVVLQEGSEGVSKAKIRAMELVRKY